VEEEIYFADGSTESLVWDEIGTDGLHRVVEDSLPERDPGHPEYLQIPTERLGEIHRDTVPLIRELDRESLWIIVPAVEDSPASVRPEGRLKIRSDLELRDSDREVEVYPS